MRVFCVGGVGNKTRQDKGLIPLLLRTNLLTTTLVSGPETVPPPLPSFRGDRRF